MAEKASLDEFLKREVPEWGDDDYARARFKAFTGQKQDWEERLNFWKDLIVKVARHLDLLVIDTQSVEQKWFIRDGVVPMGLQYVLTEMKKSGELDTVEEILGARPSNLYLVGNLLKKAIVWAGLSVYGGSYADTKPSVEERLVVMTILQERVLQFLKILKDSHHSSIYVGTLAKIRELCGGSENAELLLRCLMLQNKARSLSITGADQMEGFKISLNQNPVASVSESDHHVLQLQCTMEMLQLRLNSLDDRISLTRNAVIKSIKAGFKKEALRYARNMKVVQASRDQCAAYMDKIEQVLTIITDAETSKKVSDAMQVATTAMKENHVSLEDVQLTFNELDEAISVQRETEEALAGAPLSTSEANDDATLDDELALLEEELEAENLSLPDVPKVPVKAQESGNLTPSKETESSQEAEELLHKEFAKLAVELG